MNFQFLFFLGLANQIWLGSNVNQVVLVSVCAKFQLYSWSRSGIKVPGGLVGWGGVGCSVVGGGG